MTLKEIFSFIEFLNRFQAIERNVKVNGRKAMENDAEHSYQLAMICWQLADTKKLKLNKEKLLKYALVHDLVEVYAGDTDPHKSSKKHIHSKNEREMAAMKKIQNNFTAFKSLNQAIKDYEDRKDKESRFVYIVDKILPVINTFNVKDKYYAKNGVTLEKYISWIAKRRGSIDLKNIYLKDTIEELLEFLYKNKKGFFAD